MEDAVFVAEGFKDRFKCVLDGSQAGQTRMVWKNDALKDIRGWRGGEAAASDAEPEGSGGNGVPAVV